MNEFWKKWKRVTVIEKKAIEKVKEAKRIALKNVPREKIISIYVGGSFVRREMTARSDVDVWVITADVVSQKFVTRMIENEKGKHDPEIGFSGYALWELKTGKVSKQIKKMRTGPSRWTRNINHYELIYGKDLRSERFAARSDKNYLKKMFNVFDTVFLPYYSQGKLGFQDLVKQVFWLADLELKVKGMHTKHSWKEMAKVAPKDHIVHDGLRLRQERSKDENKRRLFVKKIKNYLSKLRKEFK